MAVDQTKVAINLCTRLQMAAEQIMSGIEEISACQAQQTSAGVVFTDPAVEDALANSSLQHCSGEDFNLVITSGMATRAWLEEQFHDDILQKVRAGT